jgi:predicted helicase
MSTYAIKKFQSDLEQLKHFGGTTKETAIRFAFQKLLDEYARSKELLLVPEVSLKIKTGKVVTPDGTLKDILRLDHGYWESKDEGDDIDEEIQKKLAKGYPTDNIIFEDSNTVILIQHGGEVLRTSIEDEEKLHTLLAQFVNFEREEIKEFREAIEHFKQDIPKVTEAIKDIINKQGSNDAYKKAVATFHELCKTSINPDVTVDDVKEMMLQHILSADIFNTIFDEPHFHQENNIARELNKVMETFFTGTARRETLGRIKHYYDTINAAAAGIADHHEKQKFLKVVYETFYKAYNPKAADRLGIVYTPNEIVQFMIRSTDYLLHKHFGKTLDSKNVEILDPATGTGTFICDIIDYLPRHKLEYKYKNELHANEVAILPYYIANLNIEYVYKQKMGQYAEFENLCFVDTLDKSSQHFVQVELFNVSAENATRIRKQNERKISVVIGNPPYNANQMNENDNNRNREYKEIDKRIKDTYVKNSNAQKTKAYDMYARFYRWASDRIMEDGIICFISNNSFLNARTFDGFRKSIQDEFQYAYFIDLGGNIRELSGKDGIFLNEKHTIFGQAAAVGIAIGFLIKDKKRKLLPCQIQYILPCHIRATRDEKLAYINEHRFENIPFENILPDKNNNWINLSEENDWGKLAGLDQIFTLNCNSIKTNRDEWLYDFNKKKEIDKIKFFIQKFNQQVDSNKFDDNSLDYTIKWSSGLKEKLKSRQHIVFSENLLSISHWRPFVKSFFYSEKKLSDRLTDNHYKIWGAGLKLENVVFNLTDCNASKDFHLLSTNTITDYHFTGDTILIPLYRYTSSGERIDNISDWALEIFRNHYQSQISKQDIFHYIYAVLHNPVYRKKYELNLKREFPRIPLYDNFPQWCKWGEQLMDLHLNYEQATPYPLNQLDIDYDLVSILVYEKMAKAKLKADKLRGSIQLDGFTTLEGIPKQAWEYKLGNRSALEWILDQYKEKKPTDPTIAEKFNTYKFADYKEKVIDLLKRVCTISVETMKIIGQMPGE